MTATGTELGARFADLDPASRDLLATLPVQSVRQGTVLFRAGEAARGFVLLFSGRIEVFLTGPSGRELLLYPVEPGGTCVQTTLGLLGGADYSAEAVAASDCRLTIIPRPLFLTLMERSAAFRSFVFAAFAGRMQDMMHVLERVAFHRIEARLAEVLLARAKDGAVEATHHDLATAIGSVREVVSRRLEAFTREGWITTERGLIHILTPDPLRRLAASCD